VQLGWTELAVAVQEGVLAPQQAQRLWATWAAQDSPLRVVGLTQGNERVSPAPAGVAPEIETAKFSFSHVLYYFGGMLAIGAMSLFMTLAWEVFGAWGSAVLSGLYFWGAWAVAGHLKAKGLPIPAGILATLALTLVPLWVWSVQMGWGLWPEGASSQYRHYHHHINWRWLTLELSTLAAAALMLWRLRLPFMVMPVAVTLWYLNMDIAHLLMQDGGWDWTFTRDVSLVWGLGTCALAVWVDLRCRASAHAHNRQDFAFWLYLFGALMFWSSLSLRSSGSEWGKAGYALINVGLVFWGAAIQRRVFTVFGGMGVAIYLGHLSWQVFADSLWFPFALTLIGFAVIALGIWWQRHEVGLRRQMQHWLPPGLRPLAHTAPPR
jgi:hypothetical protein